MGVSETLYLSLQSLKYLPLLSWPFTKKKKKKIADPQLKELRVSNICTLILGQVRD